MISNFSSDIFRISPIENNHWAGRSVSLSVAPLMSRINLRCSPSGIKPAESHFEISLPRSPKTATTTGTTTGTRTALWLGPDEWLITDTTPDISIALDKSTSSKPSSFYGVDVSHHFSCVVVSGMGCRSVLSGGCPQDLRIESFGVGSCSRTVFGKATVILHCISEDEFHIHFQRSFSPYVWEYLCRCADDIDSFIV